MEGVPTSPLLRLDNPIRPYAWGSRTYLADLLGTPSPAPEPQAELWLGAHPRAPSRVAGRSLAELVAADPDGTLGSVVAREFGGRLPFLLKVLAADRPLSLQVHPSAGQARTGYAAEQARGVPLDAPERGYADDWPKPELLVALTEFEALCGFRPLVGTLALLDLLTRGGAAGLAPYAAMLRESGDVAGVVRRLLTLAPDAAARLVTEVTGAGGGDGAFAAERAWAARLAEAYPGDPGVVVALLLAYVRLEPGEGLYLPAGNMHAYLGGAGVEVMASSDNVLRAGLTGKHVDVPELLRVLDPTPGAVPVLRPAGDGAERVYGTPAPYFRLSRLDVAGEPVALVEPGPQVLLCIEGDVALRAGAERLALGRGGSAFVTARTGTVLVEGRGRVFRVTVPVA